jgi:hypothetical protein
MPGFLMLARRRSQIVLLLSRTASILGFAVVLLGGCTQPNAGEKRSWDVGAIFASTKDKPQGEEWTILCLEARDQDRVRNVDALLSAIRQVNGLDARKARAMHEERVSRIYYGSYYRKLDPGQQREGFGPEVQQDLLLIRSLAAGTTYPFAGARLVPTPTPDVGRPEWQLRRCPGAYTLHVGVFYDTPTFSQRKEAAVQWVEQLRADGIEAYYYHGEVRSGVTVGHFGEEDVIREQTGPNRATFNTRTRYSARVDAFRKQELFRYNLENGCKVKRVVNTAEGPKEVYQESFLLPVPKGGQAPALTDSQVDRPTNPQSKTRGDY